MTTGTDAAKAAFRKYVTEGVPLSGENEPDKDEIRESLDQIGQEISTAQLGVKPYNTYADLPVVTVAYPTGTQGRVINDADPTKNRYYVVKAGAWVVDTGFYAGVATVVQPLVDDAETARDEAEGYKDDAETAAATLGLSVPPAIIIDGEIPAILEVTSIGRVIGAVKQDGTRYISTPAGLKKAAVDTGYDAGLAIPAPIQVAGQVPSIIEQDASGRVIRAVLKDGTEYIAGPGGLEKSLKSSDISAAGGYVETLFSTASSGYCYYTNASSYTLVFPVVGQSLAEGANSSGDTLLSTVPVYPGKALMPSQGVHLDGTGITSLVDLIEATGSGTRETIASGFANNLISIMNAKVSLQPRVVMAIGATAGAPYSDEKRGTADWVQVVQGIIDIVNIETAAGRKVIVPGILCVHGESAVSNGTKYAAYCRQIQQWLRDFTPVIKTATGQSEDILLFLNQESRVDTTSTYIDQPIKRAQLDADKFHDTRLVGPNYVFPRDSANNNGVHLNNTGYYRMGAMFARAVAAEVFGPGWTVMKPSAAWRASATSLVIRFDGHTAPIVNNTSGDVTNTTLTKNGFWLVDDAGSAYAISTVTVGADTITLTHATVALGTHLRLGYATVRDSPGTDDGPVYGARGTICDSDTFTALIDGHAIPQWAPSFILDIV